LTELFIPPSVVTIDEGSFNSCRNLTIIAEQGSEAEKYAIKNGIKVVIREEQN
jgi:hypothetical protein